MSIEDNGKQQQSDRATPTRTVMVIECTDSYSLGAVSHKELSAIQTHCGVQVTDDEYNALIRYAESTKYHDRWIAVLEIKQPQDVAAMIKSGKDMLAIDEEDERVRNEANRVIYENLAASRKAAELKAKRRKEKRQKEKEEIAMLRRLHLQHAQDNAAATAE